MNPTFKHWIVIVSGERYAETVEFQTDEELEKWKKENTDLDYVVNPKW